MSPFNPDKAFDDFISTHYCATLQIKDLLAKEDFEAQKLKDNIVYILKAYHNEIQADKSLPGGVYPRIDHVEFKESLPHIISWYLENKWAHSLQVSNFLCGALLDTEIYILERELSNPEDAIIECNINHISSFFAFRKLSKLFKGHYIRWGFYFILLYVTLAAENLLLNLIAGIWLMWSVRHYILQQRNINKMIIQFTTKLNEAAHRLKMIKEEIVSNNYHPDAMKERLKAAESEKIYFHSLVYSLLELK